MHPITPVPFQPDRRTFIAALCCASLAPQWEHRLLRETQKEAASRLARCAVLIADELLAALSEQQPPSTVDELP